MTAVETKPETETKYTFTSLRSELLLFLTPHRKVVHPDGTSEPVPGITAQFGPLGGFEPGVFETDDPELAERLRRSPHYGSDFFEIQVEPVAPAPTDALIAVARLVAEGNVEALVEMHEEERANWAREPVLESIRGALAALEARTEPEQPEA